MLEGVLAAIRLHTQLFANVKQGLAKKLVSVYGCWKIALAKLVGCELKSVKDLRCFLILQLNCFEKFVKVSSREIQISW